jgi:dynein heavy chain
LEDKFNLLDYYGVSISDEFITKRRNLREVWNDFTVVLEDMEGRNQKVTKEMYNETVRELDDFFKETSEFKNKFIL